MKFSTKDTSVKHTNIINIYNQIFIINYLQNILRCQAGKFWFVRSNDLWEGRGVHNCLIKIRECCVRTNILKWSKSLNDNLAIVIHSLPGPIEKFLKL
jgi:hypothetical protein